MSVLFQIVRRNPSGSYVARVQGGSSPYSIVPALEGGNPATYSEGTLLEGDFVNGDSQMPFLYYNPFTGTRPAPAISAVAVNLKTWRYGLNDSINRLFNQSAILPALATPQVIATFPADRIMGIRSHTDRPEIYYRTRRNPPDSFPDQFNIVAQSLTEPLGIIFTAQVPDGFVRQITILGDDIFVLTWGSEDQPYLGNFAPRLSRFDGSTGNLASSFLFNQDTHGVPVGSCVQDIDGSIWQPAIRSDQDKFFATPSNRNLSLHQFEPTGTLRGSKSQIYPALNSNFGNVSSSREFFLQVLDTNQGFKVGFEPYFYEDIRSSVSSGPDGVWRNINEPYIPTKFPNGPGIGFHDILFRDLFFFQGTEPAQDMLIPHLRKSPLLIGFHTNTLQTEVLLRGDTESVTPLDDRVTISRVVPNTTGKGNLTLSPGTSEHLVQAAFPSDANVGGREFFFDTVLISGKLAVVAWQRFDGQAFEGFNDIPARNAWNDLLCFTFNQTLYLSEPGTTEQTFLENHITAGRSASPLATVTRTGRRISQGYHLIDLETHAILKTFEFAGNTRPKDLEGFGPIPATFTDFSTNPPTERTLPHGQGAGIVSQTNGEFVVRKDNFRFAKTVTNASTSEDINFPFPNGSRFRLFEADYDAFFGLAVDEFMGDLGVVVVTNTSQSIDPDTHVPNGPPAGSIAIIRGFRFGQAPQPRDFNDDAAVRNASIKVTYHYQILKSNDYPLTIIDDTPWDRTDAVCDGETLVFLPGREKAIYPKKIAAGFDLLTLTPIWQTEFPAYANLDVQRSQGAMRNGKVFFWMHDSLFRLNARTGAIDVQSAVNGQIFSDGLTDDLLLVQDRLIANVREYDKNGEQRTENDFRTVDPGNGPTTIPKFEPTACQIRAFP